MWILFAVSSAVFAGLTAVIAKMGIKDVDSDVAIAVRTTVVLIFSGIMVFMTKGYTSEISGRSFIFLILSGIATGLSWICYFKALQIGDVNKVAPIDKSSTVLTIILAFIFLGERLTPEKTAGIILIGIGTYMMITRKKEVKESAAGSRWLYYAMFSAIFASLTSILGKIGITGIESNYGTAIRTAVVLLMSWIIVFMKKRQTGLKKIDRKSMIFLCISGVTTGLSWLSYYRALQDGEASVVVPVDKSSIIVTVVFSYIIFKEKLTGKAFIGLCGIVSGTLLMLFR